MISIESMLSEHWEAVRTIYLEGIATRQATFQTEAPTWPAWDNAHLVACRLVALADTTVCGWAALSPVSSRAVYAGVAEVSIYISSRFWGQQVGSRLLQALIRQSEAHQLWTLQASVFLENAASIRLHEKQGFRQIGYREKVAQHYGIWRNVALLERRSQVVGIN